MDTEQEDSSQVDLYLKSMKAFITQKKQKVVQNDSEIEGLQKKLSIVIPQFDKYAKRHLDTITIEDENLVKYPILNSLLNTDNK